MLLYIYEINKNPSNINNRIYGNNTKNQATFLPPPRQMRFKTHVQKITYIIFVIKIRSVLYV